MEFKNFSLVQSIFSFQSLLYSSVRRIFLKNSVAFFRQETLYYIRGGI